MTIEINIFITTLLFQLVLSNREEDNSEDTPRLGEKYATKQRFNHWIVKQSVPLRTYLSLPAFTNEAYYEIYMYPGLKRKKKKFTKKLNSAS